MAQRTVSKRRMSRCSTAGLFALGVVWVLVAAACGTRVPHDEVVASHGGGSELATGSVGSGNSSGDDVRAGTAPDERSVITGDNSGSDGGRGGADGRGGGDDPAARQGGERAEAGGDAGASAGDSDADSSGGARLAPGAPIRIGSVSTIAGVAGAAQKPGVDGMKVWVQMINDRGGINGHPVEYIVVDDASDPARHKAAVQDLVENKGVLAFVGQYASQTHAAARGYLEEKGVPVVGGEGMLRLWYESPMYFSQMSANMDDGSWLQWHVQARFVKGEKKAATLVCVEAPVCAEARETAARAAPQNGFELVYQGRGSLGQPDFTSECIQMRNAGATVVFAVFDFNTSRRVANSCARQGYNPQFVVGIGTSEANFAKEDGFQGAVGNMGVFPFMGGDTPAAQEYLGAYEKYAPNLALDPMGATGWVAGKLFEKAAQTIAPDEEPTTAKILEGLWSMRNETLGGLTAGLTFGQGKGSQPRGCTYALRIERNKWIAPDGMEPTCR